MKKIFRREVIIGLCVIIALLILTFGIQFLKGVNVFKAANYYYTSYTNVEGLAISAPVTLNGFKVGQVREIRYEFNNPGHVSVELSLDRNLRLPEGTRAMLATDLLGTASVALEMGTGSMHEIGDTIPGEIKKGLMNGVTENLIPSISAIFPKIDTLITNLNNITGNPALTAAVTRLDAITLELESTARQLSRMSASIAPVASDLKTITGNVSDITGDLSQASAALREAPIDSILDNLNRTSASLAELGRQLNDPNSTIGRLTSDPELYNSINATIVSLDSLFVDIKRNPKRYINVKVF